MSKVTENHFKMVHESWFAEIWSRIISEWLTNHWDSPENHFWMVCESLRFTWESFQNGSQITEIHLRINSELFENYWDSLRFAKNHIKTIRSYLFNGPQPNDRHASRSFCLYWFSLNLIDSANPEHFPTRSKPQAWITYLSLQTTQKCLSNYMYTTRNIRNCLQQTDFSTTQSDRYRVPEFLTQVQPLI